MGSTCCSAPQSSGSVTQKHTHTHTGFLYASFTLYTTIQYYSRVNESQLSLCFPDMTQPSWAGSDEWLLQCGAAFYCCTAQKAAYSTPRRIKISHFTYNFSFVSCIRGLCFSAAAHTVTLTSFQLKPIWSHFISTSCIFQGRTQHPWLQK